MSRDKTVSIFLFYILSLQTEVGEEEYVTCPTVKMWGWVTMCTWQLTPPLPLLHTPPPKNHMSMTGDRENTGDSFVNQCERYRLTDWQHMTDSMILVFTNTHLTAIWMILCWSLQRQLSKNLGGVSLINALIIKNDLQEMEISPGS